MALVINRDVLEQARLFFEERGSLGYEGTALIARLGQEPAGRLIIPHQVARGGLGCSVEVTTEGKHQLAAGLRAGEIYVARIHSHPGEAFHSSTDDNNPILTQQGAISIVAPYFGLGLRHGLDACAVFEFSMGRWRKLPPGPQRDSEVVVA